MLQKIKETADYLLNKVSARPEIAIILGTGLCDLAPHIADTTEILST